jgi:glycosyltransferase involved in cell wall biosynthesis
MSNQEDRPLATFFVIAYNHEKYIRAAVEAALTQTYTPLEIILSDDCSKDQTFSIMKEIADNYVGPHTIRLNRNEENLGIGSHINKVVELASGAFLIASAADDISLTDRTKTLVEHFIANPKCNSVFSNMKVIDSVGTVGRTWFSAGWTPPTKSLRERCRTGVGVVGCVHGWRKEIFDVYGPLDVQVIQEDHAIPFRSALSGTVDYVDKVLVHYRKHDSNIWSSEKEVDSSEAMIGRLKKFAHNRIAVRKTMFNDFLRHLKVTQQKQTDFKTEISTLEKGVRIASAERNMLFCSSYFGKAKILVSTAFRRVGIKPLARILLMGFAPRVLHAVQSGRIGSRIRRIHSSKN